MSAENSQQTNLRQKAVHEAKEITCVFLYLAIFFCKLASYSMLLLEKFEIWYFTYGPALLNALVITKIILIAEAVHFGKKHEAKPLIYSSIYTAFVYRLLVFGFHMVEEAVKRLIHGKDMAGAFRDVRIDDLLGRSVIIFLAFIAFFAFRELGRVIGQVNYGAFFPNRGTVERSYCDCLIRNRWTREETSNKRRADPPFAKLAKRRPPNEPGHLPFLVPYRFSFDNSAGWPKSRGPRGSYGRMKTYLG